MSAATLHVTEMKNSTENQLTNICRQAFHDALANRGKMDDAIYLVAGFCGKKFRLFLNNIVRELNGEARYLEVGVFAGATLCAAINNNTVSATGVDNWSWDNEKGIASTFYNNLAKYKTHTARVTIIENDFKKIQVEGLGTFNIYFYDGSHSEKDQYDGIAWAVPALERTAIVLVDDWNWAHVRTGTMDAIRDMGVTIEYMLELRTSFDDQIPEPAGGGSDWHNGFFGAVISRPAVALLAPI